jgi:endonuclease/exonuclease/phosphatase family metal-dependent hydrolase
MADKRLRLLTLNIRMGAGGGALDRPAYDIPASEDRDAALSRAIKAAGADVVALQEVRSARQAQALADRLKMSSLYAPHPASYALNFFEWGLAFLCRFKIRRSGNFGVFFDPQVRSGRNGLWVEIDLRGQPIVAVNVHLETRDQAAQFDVLTGRAARTKLPFVLMGDFNAEPQDPVMAPLQEILTDSCQMVEGSSVREALSLGTLVSTRRRIDCIFLDGSRFHVREAGLLPPAHRAVSDHLGYLAEVEIRE